MVEERNKTCWMMETDRILKSYEKFEAAASPKPRLGCFQEPRSQLVERCHTSENMKASHGII